ncbi:hypothetical protein LY622_00620 [Halomonas sp. M5N1S17]|uniref:hypothetical protein n=1 Tax=Halomonas alkalisoli TaxID=2907158 RepID=UPI001F2D7C58|nr:hypothetical protein [Halomonas alkalisoli]MCE9661933.1 hypothetical protein [Halomonas alkalisoli]
MNFDAYNKRMQSIHEQLEDIAERTFRQAVVNTADYSNPDFVALMKRHKELSDESARLVQSMLEHLDHG